MTSSQTGYSSNQTYTPSNTTKWRVFSTSAAGIEIIPEGSGEILYFRGEKAFNNWYSGILNDIANNFVNSTYADSARHLGMPRENYVHTSNGSVSSDTYPMNASDQAILNANSGLISSETTFNGALRTTWRTNATHYCIGVMYSDGTTAELEVYRETDSSSTNTSKSGAIRPIVKLKSTVFVTGGSGTSASPYTLGI